MYCTKFSPQCTEDRAVTSAFFGKREATIAKCSKVLRQEFVACFPGIVL